MTINLKFYKHFGQISEATVAAYEQRWGIKFPDSYRDFLLKINGGIPEKKFFSYKESKDDGSLIDVFFGIIEERRYSLLLNHLVTYDNRVPLNMLPIADDPGGNLLLLSISGSDYGKVYFWDHEMEADEGETPDYRNLKLIADSFEEFINGLKSEGEIDHAT